MIFNIEPYLGTELIKFGDSRENVRNKMGLDYREVKKSLKNTSDAYYCCHVHYDENDLCEAIEFFKPAILVFKDQEIKWDKYKNIKQSFKSIDKGIEYDDVGFTSYLYGIGIYAPFALKSPIEPIEGIIIFKEGYYDKTTNLL